MLRKSTLSVAFIVAAALSLVPGLARSAETTYHALKEIPVGGAASWDYLSVDEAGRRLYVSHGTEVVVIDIDKDVVSGVISNTPGVHGMAVAPDLQRGFSSNGRENKASIIDLKTLTTLSRVETGANPDGMLYEPGRQEVYMFNGRGQSATVIDAKGGKVVATIPLPGKPEFGVADPKAGRVYNNIEDKSVVVAIDTQKHEVVNTWPLAPGEAPTGLAIDLAHHRLIVGCGNEKMIVMDSTTGKVVATVPVGKGVDAAAFDPGTQLAFTSNGTDGTVTVAHEDSPDTFTVVQTIKTERGARTMTIDPRTHKIYLGSGQRGVANSFKVLVYGP